MKASFSRTFSLRTLLELVTAVAIALGVYLFVQKERAATKALIERERHGLYVLLRVVPQLQEHGIEVWRKEMVGLPAVSGYSGGPTVYGTGGVLDAELANQLLASPGLSTLVVASLQIEPDALELMKEEYLVESDDGQWSFRRKEEGHGHSH